MKYISAGLLVSFNHKKGRGPETQKSKRAGWNCLTGRFWPAGRRLPILVLVYSYLLVTWQRQMQNTWWSGYFLLRWIFLVWRNPYTICLWVSSDPMYVWISSNSCPLNLLLVRSHQAALIIVKRFIQGRINVTGCKLNPDHAIKNDAFAL